MIRKDKTSRSYKSIFNELIRDGFIPKDSKDIPLDFINKEVVKVREKRSNLPADIRLFISGMAMIDSIKKETDAKRKSENTGAEEIVMAGK